MLPLADSHSYPDRLVGPAGPGDGTDGRRDRFALSARGRPASLRGRLLAAALALLAAGLIVADVTAYLVLANQLHIRTEQNLDRGIAQLERTAIGPRVNLAAGWAQLLLLPNTAVMAWAPDGTLLANTFPSDVTGLPSTPDDRSDRAVVGYVTRKWRPAAPVEIGSPIGTIRIADVLIGIAEDDNNKTLRTLVWVEIGAGLLIVAAGLVFGRVVLRRALRPLRQIAQAADRIQQGADEAIPSGPAGTETHDLATSLDQAFAARARSEAAARQFLADASHELRTPVTAIRAWADLYAQGALPADADVYEAMTSIAVESTRISVLVEQMLTLARLDAGGPNVMRAATAEVDLAALTRESCAAVRPLVDGNPGRLRALNLVADVQELSDGGPAGRAPTVVLGDSTALRRVIDNLVINAVRHAGPEAVIDVGIEFDERAVAVVVADTGPGLPAADLERAFDRFWLGRQGRGGDAGGSGLGLAIARQIARAHGGDVHLAPAHPHGLIAILTVPGRTDVGTQNP